MPELPEEFKIRESFKVGPKAYAKRRKQIEEERALENARQKHADAVLDYAKRPPEKRKDYLDKEDDRVKEGSRKNQEMTDSIQPRRKIGPGRGEKDTTQIDPDPTSEYNRNKRLVASVKSSPGYGKLSRRTSEERDEAAEGGAIKKHRFMAEARRKISGATREGVGQINRVKSSGLKKTEDALMKMNRAFISIDNDESGRGEDIRTETSESPERKAINRIRNDPAALGEAKAKTNAGRIRYAAKVRKARDENRHINTNIFRD